MSRVWCSYRFTNPPLALGLQASQAIANLIMLVSRCATVCRSIRKRFKQVQATLLSTETSRASISRSMNEKRAAHIRMVVAMTKAGGEDLLLTKDKSAYFLRGIIDYAENGRHANLDVRWAPSTYEYSKHASVLKHEKSAYQQRSDKTLAEVKLHAEHIIPNNLIFKRLLEMVENESSDTDMMNFLDTFCRIVVITKREMQLLDGAGAGLKSSMPDGWVWGGDPYARLNHVGIVLE